PAAAGPAGDLAAVADVRIARVRRRVAVLLDRDGLPVPHGDRAFRAPGEDAGCTALLLPAAEAVGKGVVGGDMEHLRGGLGVIAAPGSSSVHADDGALVAGDQH